MPRQEKKDVYEIYINLSISKEEIDCLNPWITTLTETRTKES